ncbi:DUF1190 domain-containing protein [Luteibacter aegosomatissinici]|uniref:DUF1190 domain-containing protein n=1 Tax=Luteibacter aegosomatissinici TaxID=2911539 RepID=UPI001FF74EFA|nr:DUF1190 domain-containing protein [Luteibacter aegosomatissinici]UPG94432.1 DUF1190 domain-containing protein [Luteibacter aegosomatissinici]
MANKDKKSLSGKASPAGKPDAKFNLPPDYRHPSFYPSGKAEPLFNFGERGKRMRSAAVVVGVLGLFGYAAWPRTDVQRNSYTSKEDCEHDYATGKCTFEPSTGNSDGYSTGGGYHYYGPWYRSDWRTNPVAGDPGPGRSYASGARGGASGFTGHGPTGFDFGSRGGFGSSGRVGSRGG